MSGLAAVCLVLSHAVAFLLGMIARDRWLNGNGRNGGANGGKNGERASRAAAL